jgi:hypothetical protein
LFRCKLNKSPIHGGQYGDDSNEKFRLPSCHRNGFMDLVPGRVWLHALIRSTNSH